MRKRANRSFKRSAKEQIALFKKSERAQKERIALSLFFLLFLAKKRAIRSFPKRAIAQPWILVPISQQNLSIILHYMYTLWRRRKKSFLIVVNFLSLNLRIQRNSNSLEFLRYLFSWLKYECFLFFRFFNSASLFFHWCQ